MKLIVALMLVAAGSGYAPSPVARQRSGILSRAPTRILMSETEEATGATETPVVEKTDEEIEEEELIEEAKEIAKRKRSNMFSPSGVAYAPWLINQIDEEAIEIAKSMRSARKYQERKDKEQDGIVSVVDATTAELTGSGLKIKVLSDSELELAWVTDMEDGISSYTVEKKMGTTKTWTPVGKVASKGAYGGSYTFFDDEAELGIWSYRVVGEEGAAGRSVTCQLQVNVESAGQQLTTKVLVGVLGVTMAAAIAAGFLLDPNNN